MTRHPRLPVALLAAILLGTACSTAAGEELGAATLETTTTVDPATTTAPPPTTTAHASCDGDGDGDGDGLGPDCHYADSAVATAIEFLEESEAVATAAPDQVEEILTPYLHASAPDRVLEHVLASTAENQELGLVEWRHAVLETRVDELANGDVRVEAWQVAVITLEPDRGPSRAASVWATDTLTLTDTDQGWKIIDRVVRSGPTPEPTPAVIPDDGALLEARLDGFSDAHPSRQG